MVKKTSSHWCTPVEQRLNDNSNYQEAKDVFHKTPDVVMS